VPDTEKSLQVPHASLLVPRQRVEATRFVLYIYCIYRVYSIYVMGREGSGDLWGWTGYSSLVWDDRIAIPWCRNHLIISTLPQSELTLFIREYIPPIYTIISLHIAVVVRCHCYVSIHSYNYIWILYMSHMWQWDRYAHIYTSTFSPIQTWYIDTTTIVSTTAHTYLFVVVGKSL
jgi:hypothetical protein